MIITEQCWIHGLVLRPCEKCERIKEAVKKNEERRKNNANH